MPLFVRRYALAAVSALIALCVGVYFSEPLNRVFLTYMAPMNARAALESDNPRPLPPNAVDIGFAQSMQTHHNQAILMAMWMKAGRQNEIAALADSIILSQTHENGLLKGWLTAWGAPLLSIQGAMDWVKHADKPLSTDDQMYASLCLSNPGLMPGMASPEQLQMLQNTRGAAQEKLFLELMIAHHRSALPMAQFAYNNGQSPLIKGFAVNVISEQRTEIAWMQGRLRHYATSNPKNAQERSPSAPSVRVH